MTKGIPNDRLKREREKRNWTQAEVAEKIGTDPVNISRWENGTRNLGLHSRRMLCELYGKSPIELGFLDEEFEYSGEPYADQPLKKQVPPFPRIWNIPAQIPFFTGRTQVIEQLHNTLITGKTTVLTQAISGLGGIGKTQTAIEYAYKYRTEYQAALWIEAETREQLIASFLTIVSMLNLPERRQKDPQRIIEAVKQWMKDHPFWLIIFDNVEDVALIETMTPPTGQGHILLTTRTQATGNFVINVELDEMEPDEGALLLLYRSHYIPTGASLEDASRDDRETARQISHLLGGLPLALIQAGAYIKEVGSSLSRYLELYRERRAELLQWHSPADDRYPASVATTWSLSFEKIQQEISEAADLLRFCAFLAPDAIPEGIALAGSKAPGSSLQHVTDAFALDQALAVLRRFSLVRRYPKDHTFSIHRLVQAVVMDKMDQVTQRQWAERSVRAVTQALSSADMAVLDQFAQYVPHVQMSAAFIEQWHFTFEEAANLLFATGAYLREIAWYASAEPLSKQAMELSTQIFEPGNLRAINSLTNLAFVYQEQDKYSAAEEFLLQALAACQLKPDADQMNVASCLNNVAQLYRRKGDYLQAEQFYRQALTLLDALGEEHPQRVISLNGLAVLYSEEGNYDLAEPLYKSALAIRQKTLPSDDLDLALSYHNLANNYAYQRKYQQAQPLSQKALEIFEKAFGKEEHPFVAQCLNSLGEIYAGQEKYDQAEPLFLRSLAIKEKMSGLEHSDVAQSLVNLGALHENQAQYGEAESLYQRALSITEKSLGKEHPKVVFVLMNYKSLLRKMGRHEEVSILSDRIRFIKSRYDNPPL